MRCGRVFSSVIFPLLLLILRSSQDVSQGSRFLRGWSSPPSHCFRKGSDHDATRTGFVNHLDALLSLVSETLNLCKNSADYPSNTPLSSPDWNLHSLRRRKIKRCKCPCSYYRNSCAVFHVQLIGDLVFKLNPGPVTDHKINTIVHNRGFGQSSEWLYDGSSGLSLDEAHRYHRGANLHNLTYVKHFRKDFNTIKTLTFCTLNAQSIRNKTAVFQDYLCQEQIDLCAVTESWLRPDDAAVRAECTPPGFNIIDHPREGRGGGGIAIVYKSKLSLVKNTAGQKRSFEFAEYIVSSGTDKIRLIVIYRAPYSPEHRITVSTFLEEFADYVESVILSPETLLITGDMNIHVDNVDDADAIKFLDLLDCMGLVQHVRTPTHRLGHTLDLIITREASHLIQTTPVSDYLFSDHFSVLCNLTFRKPAMSVKKVSYRKIKSINMNTFKDDLRQSDLVCAPPQEINDLVSCYNLTCSSLLDKHAPLLKKTITVRPRVPWFNDTIKTAKRERRKRERVWRTTGLETDRILFTRARNHVNCLIEQARREYYTDFVTDNSKDQRCLFNAVNRLLGCCTEERYPPYTEPGKLANDFGQFFIRKIENIRTELDNMDSLDPSEDTSISRTFTGSPLFEFKLISTNSVKKLITCSPSKSCDLDPVPTSLVKECQEQLYSPILSIINASLQEGYFPDSWKRALVKPKLKKQGLDLCKKNYRPVSNLQFLSKLAEKAVAQQTISHIEANGLFPVMQSAYRKLHSTETALLRIRNDILMNMNSQHVTLLVLLDMSAAFDTIDHTKLLQRLENKFGITGTALDWFSSYLTGRFQQVIIDGATSDEFEIPFGVPQGSCLGPLLFSLYTSELFDIIAKHLPTVHCYADDTQLYLAFRPDDQATQDSAVAAMEACIRDIRRWMVENKLKLNDDKSEFMLIGTKVQLRKVNIDGLVIGNSKIEPTSDTVRNLGAWFDCYFTMDRHVNQICKAGYFYLHNISRIRKYLTRETTERLVHAFIHSRLDYCNSLLYGLPDCLLAKLQRVQNSAARLVDMAPKFSHITPILMKLHWLNVRSRISFKIIVITYKVLNGMAPEYISDLISLKPASTYGLRSNNKQLLKVLPGKLLATLGDRAFAAAAPKLWNKLPMNLRTVKELSTFKSKLKTHLFKITYLN